MMNMSPSVMHNFEMLKRTEYRRTTNEINYKLLFFTCLVLFLIMSYLFDCSTRTKITRWHAWLRLRQSWSFPTPACLSRRRTCRCRRWTCADASRLRCRRRDRATSACRCWTGRDAGSDSAGPRAGQSSRPSLTSSSAARRPVGSWSAAARDTGPGAGGSASSCSTDRRRTTHRSSMSWVVLPPWSTGRRRSCRSHHGVCSRAPHGVRRGCRWESGYGLECRLYEDIAYTHV